MRRDRGARLYAALLHLYPRRLRREQGAEMLAHFRAQAAEARRGGARARVVFAIRMALDLVRSVPAEHAYAYRLKRGTRPAVRRPRGALPDSILQDVRFALRSFARARGFTFTMLATLGIGIGATTTMVGVVDGILLRPLPYAGEGVLVQIGLRAGDHMSGSVAPSDYFDVAERSRTLEAVAVSRLQWMDLAGTGEPERLDAAGVSHAFFEVLGAAPALGRGFRPADDSRAAEAVVVLSDGLWRRRFGAASDVVGRTLLLNDAPFTVVGVMPAGFRAPEAIYQGGAELWFPLGRVDDPLDVRGDAFVQMIARARRGFAIADVRADLDRIGARLGEEFPDVGPRDFWTEDLRDRTVGDARRLLWLLLGAVALLLLIACANAANLWLVRATERGRELSIRAALGAGRIRVARQLLTESVLLALGAGGIGALLARFGIDAFRAFAPPDMPRLADLALDVRVLGFATVLSLLTGLLFGSAPLLFDAPHAFAARLRSASGDGAPLRGHGLRRTFAALQIAIALVLLTGAGLLLNTFIHLSSVDPGFHAGGVAWIEVAPPTRRYASADARMATFRSVMEQIRAVPGVRSAGAINGLPLQPNRSVTEVRAEGSGADPDAARRTSMHAVMPGTFATLGIRLLAGRDVSTADRAESEPVAVVNRSLARALWRDGGAPGRRFRFAESDGAWITVVGIVADVRHYGLAEPPAPILYRPVAQYPRTWLSFAVRHDGNATAVLDALRDAVWRVDPALPLDDAGTAGALLDASLVQERFRTAIVGAFAAVALGLTFIGLYGTLSHLVRSRRREMGIRLALGAAGRDIQRDIVRHGIAIAALGLALGLPAALLASRLLGGFVFGLSTADPATFAAVAAFILVVALLASWIPARRAAAVDPVQTLRAD